MWGRASGGGGGRQLYLQGEAGSPSLRPWCKCLQREAC